jgi:hypothetical protein
MPTQQSLHSLLPSLPSACSCQRNNHSIPLLHSLPIYSRSRNNQLQTRLPRFPMSCALSILRVHQPHQQKVACQPHHPSPIPSRFPMHTSQSRDPAQPDCQATAALMRFRMAGRDARWRQRLVGGHGCSVATSGIGNQEPPRAKLRARSYGRVIVGEGKGTCGDRRVGGWDHFVICMVAHERVWRGGRLVGIGVVGLV